MKSFWVLSASLIFIGFCIFLYSRVPQMVQEPYMKLVTQSHDDVLQDGTISALSSFYNKVSQFKSGDRISITASINDGTLSADVTDMWTLKEIASQNNVKSISLDVTIPRDSSYEISVNRYRKSVFVIFLEKTNAYIKVTTKTTQEAWTQAYRSVATYPYKNLETAGFAVMVAGIGAGVLSIAQAKREYQ